MREARRQVLDPTQMSWSTHRQADYLTEITEAVTNAKFDADRVERLKQGHCKVCHYIRTARIGGAAMTTVTCGICQKEMTFGSTATDTLCVECAREHNLCKRCGADSELRPRRRDLKFYDAAKQAFANSQIGHTPEKSG